MLYDLNLNFGDGKLSLPSEEFSKLYNRGYLFETDTGERIHPKFDIIKPANLNFTKVGTAWMVEFSGEGTPPAALDIPEWLFGILVPVPEPEIMRDDLEKGIAAPGAAATLEAETPDASDARREFEEDGYGFDAPLEHQDAYRRHAAEMRMRARYDDEADALMSSPTPTPPKTRSVGDRVRCARRGLGTIRKLDGSYFWVEFENGTSGHLHKTDTRDAG